MAADIGQELYEKIKAEFEGRVSANGYIKAVTKRIAEGTATMNDVSLYAKALGSEVRLAIAYNISPEDLPEGQMFYNIAQKILDPLLHDNHSMVNDIAAQVQKKLDERKGIRIKPQKAPFPEDRLGSVLSAASEQGLDEATMKRRMSAPAETMTQSFADDYMKENAKFRTRAGFKEYIVRKEDGKCCEWCSKLAGRYLYPESTPHDVFRRHDNCGCSVTYEDGEMRQDAWSKRTWQASPEELAERKELEEKLKPVRFSPEEAAAKEREVLEQRAERLTNGGESGIIIAKEDLKKITDSMPNASDADEFVNLVNNCKNEDIKRAYRDCLNQVDKVEYNSERGGESYYLHADNRLVYSYPTESDIEKGDTKFSSVTHEIGHLIDYKGVFDNLTFSESDALNTSIHTSFTFKQSPSGSDQFLEAVRKDKANLAKIVMKSDVRQDLFSTISSGGVQDALDGMFGAKVKMRYGHGEKYYNKTYNSLKSIGFEKKIQEAYKQLGFDASNQAKVQSLVRCHTVASEVWANITSAETCGSADLGFFKKYLPNSYDSFISIMKGLR